MVLASLQALPVAIAVDGSSVYWTDYGSYSNGGTTYIPSSGSVMKVPVAGGTPMALAATVDRPRGIAVDATNVYWVTLGTPPTDYHDGAVMRCPTQGCPGGPSTLIQGQDSPIAIAVDATNLYWASGSAPLMTMPTSGGNGTVLAASPGWEITLSSSSLSWSYEGTAPGFGDGKIMTLPIGGGNPIVLASMQARPHGIFGDDANVYWTNDGDGTLRRLPRGGGNVVTIASGQNEPSSVVVDAARIYWCDKGSSPNYSDGGIMTIVLGMDSAPMALATGQGQPSHLVADQTSLYWINANDPGEVMKVAKP